MDNPELFDCQVMVPIDSDVPISVLTGTKITLRDLFAAAAMTIAKTPMKTNGHLSPMYETMIPPKSGPNPMPSVVTEAVKPYALPILSRGIIVETSALTEGITPPAASPVAHRSKKSTQMLGASACGMEVRPVRIREITSTFM